MNAQRGLVAFAVCGIAAAFMPTEETPWTLLIGGDTNGYLSPCGCTKPMSGGIRRRAQATQNLSQPNRTIVLENSGLANGIDRQNVLKAEAMAEIAGTLNAIIHLGQKEAAFGRGQVIALHDLSRQGFITGSIDASDLGIPSSVRRGPIRIGAVTLPVRSVAQPLQAPPQSPEDYISELCSQAEREKTTPILMLQGTLSEATQIAKDHPQLRLIVYRSTGVPNESPVQVGKTWLVSPGEKGKHLVKLEIVGGAPRRYLVQSLNPDVQDQETASRLYANYLHRVSSEGLLDKIVRKQSEAFAGSKACLPCHQEAHKIWSNSAHAGALQTLEKDSHDRDPDCVSCHVVGLESMSGFISRQKTPDLSDVGCESCHGPAKAHSLDPYRFRLGKVGEKSCEPCHVPEHSPEFTFNNYWKKIAH
jgi:hypothetical protein